MSQRLVKISDKDMPILPSKDILRNLVIDKIFQDYFVDNKLFFTTVSYKASLMAEWALFIQQSCD